MRNWKHALFAATLAVIPGLAQTTPAISQDAVASGTTATSPVLGHILLAASDAQVHTLTADPHGSFLQASPELASLALEKLQQQLLPASGQQITPELLAKLGEGIQRYVRDNGYPTATVDLPTQRVGNGIVRFVLALKPVTLRQVLIAEGAEAAQQLRPVPAGGLVVLSPGLGFLKREELAKRLATGENQPMNDRLLAGVAHVIETFIQQESPFAKVVVPPQEISDGTLRIGVVLGKVGNIQIDGNRWFSDALLREKLKIEKGETLKLSDLDRALSWVNNNPFRRLRVKVDRSAESGEADILVAVQEAFPLRLMASYDNGGNPIIGTQRFTAAASYGNLFGRDHQGSYQFITTEFGPSLFQGHGLDYRIPLPSRHILQVGASYLHAKPEFYGGIFVRDGRNITANLRYTVPLREGDNPIEVFAAFDFKQSNNNLAFGGDIVDADAADIFQLSIGGSLVKRDKLGGWGFAGTLTASPGGVNSRNQDAAFITRLGAEASYVYGNVSVQRALRLPRNGELLTRAVLQYAGQNLLASEQLTVGGSATVRGYPENVFAGENGYVVSSEVRSRPFLMPTRARGPLDTRFLAFFDAAEVFFRHRYPRIDVTTGNQVGWDDDGLQAMASAGIGLRMSWASNFSLSADYGWQLKRISGLDDHSRGHIRVMFAY